MRVHQVLSGAGPRDAVTAVALAFRSKFLAWGWDGGDYAGLIVPGLNGAIAPLARLESNPDDVLLLHHSAQTSRLGELLALSGRKLLLYHNVTPPEWLWDQAPVVAAQCHIGRDQLTALVRAVDVAAAVSEFNAGELKEHGASRTEVIPPLLNLDALGAPGPRSSGPPTILFVGRLSPHKRQDEVIRAFALYRRYRCPDARLVLVGDPMTASYGDRLWRLAQELAPGAVVIESGLSATELGERYRSADAFLCLSEHEGFCIPLLEAFHFGLPVIARPAGAIPETVGDGALLVDDPDLAVIAELVHLAVGDEQLRAELRRRAEAQLATFAPELVAARLKRVVETTEAPPA